MSLNRCPFCEQMCPADAKFCSACGGALHLVPCARCGAVNDVTATACYQCHGQLPGRGTDERDPASPAAEVPRPLPRRRPQVMVGAAVLAAVVVLGYYGYRQSSLVDLPQPATAGSEASGRGGPAGSGPVGGDAAAGDTTPAKSDAGAQAASPATSPPETPLADRTPAVGSERRADRETEELRQARTAAGLIVRSRAADAGKAGRQAAIRQEVCTEAVAALGLCTMTLDQTKQADAAVSKKAAVAAPEAAVAGKAGQQEPPRQGACTEAVAALGLCTPAPTQRRE